MKLSKSDFMFLKFRVEREGLHGKTWEKMIDYLIFPDDEDVILFLSKAAEEEKRIEKNAIMERMTL